MTIDEARSYFYDADGRFLTKKFLKDESPYKEFLLENVPFESIEELAYRLKHDDL